MPELVFVCYILMFFIFPVPTLAITLGAGTSLFIYRRRLLFQNQPAQGKKVLWLHFLSNTLNLLLSVGLSVAIATLVYLIIYRSFFLFLFNLIFCTLIALRWFDFSNTLFRGWVMPMIAGRQNPQPGNRFAMVYGLRPCKGWGLGMTPVFVDAGILSERGHKFQFQGVFTQQEFDPSALHEIEKISSEKLHLVPNVKESPPKAEAYMVVLRDRFYPFKSQGIRDKIYSSLSVFQSMGKPGGTSEPVRLPSTSLAAGR